jgi:hypothetical protein
MTKLIAPEPSSNAAAISASPPPPVGGSMPPTALTAEEKAVSLAVAMAVGAEVAVGEGVRGPPPITVTSGPAVAVGSGASTHLVTLSPVAPALVVQNEPCAKALGASANTPTKHSKVSINNLLTTPALLGR